MRPQEGFLFCSAEAGLPASAHRKVSHLASLRPTPPLRAPHVHRAGAAAGPDVGGSELLPLFGRPWSGVTGSQSHSSWPGARWALRKRGHLPGASQQPLCTPGAGAADEPTGTHPEAAAQGLPGGEGGPVTRAGGVPASDLLPAMAGETALSHCHRRQHKANLSS